jgi:hypothetical protein
MPEYKRGHYTGELILRPLPDGRRMRTEKYFGFRDPEEMRWDVPPNTEVDGASIPRILWTLVGGPWEGRYRDASVVHDYYCSVRSTDWKAVHRMFYDGMLASYVPVYQAKIFWAAVRFAGPRWTDMDVHNVRLGPPAVPTRVDSIKEEAARRREVDRFLDDEAYRLEEERRWAYQQGLLDDPISTAFLWAISAGGTRASEFIRSPRTVRGTYDVTLDLGWLDHILVEYNSFKDEPKDPILEHFFSIMELVVELIGAEKHQRGLVVPPPLRQRFGSV